MCLYIFFLKKRKILVLVQGSMQIQRNMLLEVAKYFTLLPLQIENELKILFV